VSDSWYYQNNIIEPWTQGTRFYYIVLIVRTIPLELF
jgi:hypothetical protein